jgi:hypothetical protein
VIHSGKERKRDERYLLLEGLGVKDRILLVHYLDGDSCTALLVQALLHHRKGASAAGTRREKKSRHINHTHVLQIFQRAGGGNPWQGWLAAAAVTGGTQPHHAACPTACRETRQEIIPWPNFCTGGRKNKSRHQLTFRWTFRFHSICGCLSKGYPWSGKSLFSSLLRCALVSQLLAAAAGFNIYQSGACCVVETRTISAARRMSQGDKTSGAETKTTPRMHTEKTQQPKEWNGHD